MMETIEAEFGVPIRWVESESRNTFENARYSAQILQGAGIQRAFLVSHAWHMPALQKSAYAFHEYLGNLWYRLRYRNFPKAAPAPD